MEIGFIGLGGMGRGMARNLIKAGHRVTVWNRSPGPAQALAEAGALVAASPAGAARPVTITMLADDAALEAVTFGPDGIAAALGPGAVHVSMSTISVALAERLTAAHGERGAGFVSAPVLGRPDAAAAGKLFILAAGAPAALGQVRPALDAIGQRVFALGEVPSQANLIKLSANFLITCVIESLAEVYALIEKAGLDPAPVHQMLTETLFAAPVYKTYGQAILDDRYSPPGFTLPLGAKDNRLVLQAAERLAVPLPLASLLRDRFIASLARGEAALDWAAIARRAGEDAGLARGGDDRTSG